jgi:hypothetical protein
MEHKYIFYGQFNCQIFDICVFYFGERLTSTLGCSAHIRLKDERLHHQRDLERFSAFHCPRHVVDRAEGARASFSQHGFI